MWAAISLCVICPCRMKRIRRWDCAVFERFSRTRPDLMRAQLRAALRVTPFGVVRVLVPMVTDVPEILKVLQRYR